MKTKFKINVKVKIPIESTLPEPEPSSSPEQIHNDSTPFNLKDPGIDNAHHNAMSIRQKTLEFTEMKIGKKFSAAAPLERLRAPLMLPNNSEPVFYSARSQAESARDDGTYLEDESNTELTS